jgi:hypothetical protein
MREITHNGSQYLRCSAFNPDKAAMKRGLTHVFRSDADFVSGQKGRVRFDQRSFIAPTMAFRSR